MFDFLQKPTHLHHQIKPISQSKNISIKSPKQQNLKENKNHSLTNKLQKGSQAALDQDTLRILYNIQVQSEKQLESLMLMRILSQTQDKIQRKVYVRQMSSKQSQYLNEVYEQANIKSPYLHSELDSMMKYIKDQIENQIYNDELSVHRKLAYGKNDLIEMQRQDKYRLIKIRQGEIKNKVGQLKMELNLSQIVQQNAKQIINKYQYDGKDHYKTKYAQQFVMKKKIQRQQIQKKAKQREQKERQKKRNCIQAQEKINQQIKSQRHQRLEYQINNKQKLRNEEKQQRMQDQKQFEHFIKQFKKKQPLYIKKQYQHAEQERNINKQRIEKMLKLKDKYETIDENELRQHERRYLELKQQYNDKRKAQIQLFRSQDYIRQRQFRNRFYKGKYRYMIENQMQSSKMDKTNDIKIDKKMKRNKAISYSYSVKAKYPPKIDKNKKSEIQNLIKQNKKGKKYKNNIKYIKDQQEYNNNQNKSYIPIDIYHHLDVQPSAKKQGQKNRRQLKQYLNQKIKKGEIKQPKQHKQVSLTPKTDYLKQMRNKKTHTSTISQKALNDKIQPSSNDVGILLVRANQLDTRLKRKQMKLRNVEHLASQQEQLQNEYMKAIRIKMQLLKNYN